MSFYTALTGLKGAQQDISTTSNNIANVGSTGFKKSRTEFGDIFGTTPLQTNVVGAGTAQNPLRSNFLKATSHSLRIHWTWRSLDRVFSR
jgi:flagellar hook protein FlgE